MILFGLCFISGILGAVYQGAFDFAAFIAPNSFVTSGLLGINVPFVETVGLLGSTSYTFLITFFSCVIIFQNIIPIALYISVDVAKTIQVLIVFMIIIAVFFD